ncbi:hypothetical protein MKK69_12955 [Methylobacterium sp. J-026]|uniref:hypothetical protein n=1 Tax=Methylobacterium sp. J-026 TaxID=2836624 RepID=UPI001FBA86BD|nr:hypothetical protein [Methylobacterium sp. J-026]MCJ2134960.1 hypothetical protein [Methylobacterium sp. J-026]
MRFFIDHDDGHSIRGWIVPDNQLATSHVVVSVEGRRVATVAASLTDPTFKNNGWHATGQCIFVVTEADVPGLSGLERLELYDADTNVLVHRRVPMDSLLQMRMCLINTGIDPETVLQSALFPHFERSYFGLHRMSDEILTSLFLNAARSVLLSGAVVIPRYENFMTPDLMLTALLVQDPYIEMATRLHWLKARAADAADPARGWRLAGLAEAAAFTNDYDLTDLKSLKRFFRMLPESAYRLLYNPLTRQLGTRMPEDRLHPGNSIAAIEVLSRVGIVGHKARFGAFARTLFDQLGLDVPLPEIPEPSAAVRDLAQHLRAIRTVEEMLIFDVAISDAIKDIVDKHWGS